MTEDFSQKALVWKLWDWMIRQRPNIFRQLGRWQKERRLNWLILHDNWVTGRLICWVIESLGDWVTWWLSHHWHVLTLTDNYCHLLTLTVTYCYLQSPNVIYCHLLSPTVTYCHPLSPTVTYWHILAFIKAISQKGRNKKTKTNKIAKLKSTQRVLNI